VTFLSNWGTTEGVSYLFKHVGGSGSGSGGNSGSGSGGAFFLVPAWSVSMVSNTCSSGSDSGGSDSLVLLLNTKTDAERGCRGHVSETSASAWPAALRLHSSVSTPRPSPLPSLEAAALVLALEMVLAVVVEKRREER
jgi:hypothetical protein